MAWTAWEGESGTNSELQEFIEANKISRKKIFSFLVACVVFQASLSMFIMTNALESSSNLEVLDQIPTADLGFSKFVAAMVMHI